MPAGNVKTTSEWSTVLLPKVRLRLAVWWQGKYIYISSIFKQNFWNYKETYFSISVVNFLPPPPPPPPLGKYAYPGWYAAGHFVRCMWHVLYIDWFMYIYIIPQHHLPHINLCGIISFNVMLGVCPVLLQSWQSPWGARGPQSRAQGAQIVSGILDMFANIWLIFALIIYKGHMKTLSSRCVLVLMALFIWLCN